MKLLIIFGALAIINAGLWLSVDALDESKSITVPTTLAAVRDLVER